MPLNFKAQLRTRTESWKTLQKLQQIWTQGEMFFPGEPEGTESGTDAKSDLEGNSSGQTRWSRIRR